MANTRDSDTCLCQVCGDVRKRLNKIFIVLDTYRWLLDTYIVDFFEENVWSKLPSEWTKVLDDVRPEELGEWILGKSSGVRIWPLSLLAFRKTIESLVINRDYAAKEILQCKGSQQRYSNNMQRQTKDSPSLMRKQIVDPKYEILFKKSVKMKKYHEIENISKTTFECASAAKCECIVDIGAGLGHLARLLTYNYGLCVVCLEQDELLSHQARKYDEKLCAILRKNNPNILERHPYHIQTRVSETDIQGQGLMKKLKNEFIKNFHLENSNDAGFGLIGLHPCGDLAATLLKFYAQQKDVKFICIVGCCYMKITSGTKETASFGYPMSKYVSTTGNHTLSYAALEVACHAIENYCDKLKSGDYQDLLVHAYRATLETILILKNGKSIRRSHLKNVKLKENMSFDSYCTRATENLALKNKLEPADFKTIQVSNCLKRWHQVVAFGTLRFMLAPLVESAILLDRFLYISEKNLEPSLRPIFDARISPRNIVLISCK